MSLIRAIDLACDNCNSQYDNPDWQGYLVRASAKDEGWATELPGGRDLCPRCRTFAEPRAIAAKALERDGRWQQRFPATLPSYDHYDQQHLPAD